MRTIGAPPRQRRQRPLGPSDPRTRNGKRQGLTPAEVDWLFDRQGGTCAVGGEPLNPETMVVDHDHLLARAHGHDERVGCPRCVRGLCCPKHNAWLGWGGEDPAIFQRAAVYVAWRRS